MKNSEELAADHQPPLARRFDAGNAEEAKSWQSECRRGLAAGQALSGFLETRADTPLNATITGTQDMGHSTFSKMTFDVTPEWTTEALLTVPKQGERFPAVLCVHALKEDVYPQAEYCVSNVGKRNRKGRQPYGAALAERGFVTIAADFNAPAPDAAGRERSNGSERIRLGLRLVDCLCARDDVDAGRIGTVGICKWAVVACHLAALDPRIRAVVSACALMRDQHGVPFPMAGADLPPFDLPDLYGLLAPRPVLCQFGEADPMRPQYPTEAEIEETRRRYVVLGGRREDIEVLWHAGGHTADLGSLPDFFDRALE